MRTIMVTLALSLLIPTLAAAQPGVQGQMSQAEAKKHCGPKPRARGPWTCKDHKTPGGKVAWKWVKTSATSADDWDSPA